MKNIVLILCSALLVTLSKAHGLENVIIEKYYISDANDAKAKTGGHLPVGSVTYRIFIDMLPGYRFQAAYGVSGHELRIATTTSFFNNEDYGGVVPNVIPDRNLKDNTVMLDSWLSAGGASEGSLGILKTDDDSLETVVNDNGFLQNENPAAGIPIKTHDGFIIGTPPLVTSFGIDSAVGVFKNKTSGNVFSTNNGSWATMKGFEGPTPANRVLIAQLTTDGILSFELNIQIGTSDGKVENYVARNPVGKEILFPGLVYSSETDSVLKNMKKSTTKK